MFSLKHTIQVTSTQSQINSFKPKHIYKFTKLTENPDMSIS